MYIYIRMNMRDSEIVPHVHTRANESICQCVLLILTERYILCVCACWIFAAVSLSAHRPFSEKSPALAD